MITPDSKTRLQYIDVLRCLAILGVVLVHTAQYGTKTEGLPVPVINIVYEGARGVQLFFLISAFTILLSFNSHQSQERFAKSNFFIRRFFRIAPLYYLAVLFYGLYQTSSEISLSNFLSSFLFLKGFSPFWINSIVPGEWSIVVEMMFYVSITFLVYYIKDLKSAVIAFFVAGVFKTIMTTYLINHPLISSIEVWNTFLYFYFPNQLPLFLMGFILYFVIFDERSFNRSPFYLSLVVTSVLIASKINFPYFETNLMVWGLAFLGLAFVLKNIIKDNSYIKLPVHIGKVSYSVYLIHFAVLGCLDKIGFIDFMSVTGKATAILNFFLRYLLVLLLSVAIATLTYRFIELPFIKLGSRIIKKRESK